MYLAAHYEKWSSTLYLHDDQRGWILEKCQPSYFVRNPEGEFRTLYGDRVSRCDGYDPANVYDYFEVDVDPLIYELVHRYMDQDQPSDSHKVLFFDIETVKNGALTRQLVQDAPNPITSVALYDQTTGIRCVMIVDPDQRVESGDVDGVKLVVVDSEEKLLNLILRVFEKIRPTILCGWNSQWFDIPYIYFRIKNRLGIRAARRLSPVKKVIEQHWDEKMPVKIVGINSMDYMLLYKRFIPKRERSYRLHYIGQKVVKMGKLSYKGDLNDLYRDDIAGYIAYNMRDVDILVELDKKLAFIELTKLICYSGCVPLDKIYSPSVVLESFIYRMLKQRGIVSPNKPHTYHPELKRRYEEDEEEDEGSEEKKKFKGAYVKEPQVGIHDWLTDIDLESLYPRTIQGLNAGTDTLVGRIVDTRYEELEGLGLDTLSLLTLKDVPDPVFQYADGSTHIMSFEDIERFVKSNNYTISGNGIIFRTDKKSILREICEILVARRKEYKNRMSKEAESGNFEAAKFYDLYQSVFKILANSVYGCLALASFRYTDPRKWLSTAVTLTGQVVIRNSIDFSNIWMNRRVGTQDVDYVVASDTDSIFIKCYPLVVHRNSQLSLLSSDDDMIPVVRTIGQELASDVNRFYTSLAKISFNMNGHFFKIKSEYVIKKAFWIEKKKYACFLIEREGVRVEPGKEVDIKGLESKKADFPEIFTEFYDTTIEKILRGADRFQIQTDLIAFKKYTETCPVQEMCRPASLRDYEKYTENRNRVVYFGNIASRTPVHVKSAIFYNDFIDLHGLPSSYHLQTGDSFYWCYLNRNELSLSSLCCIGDDDPDELLRFLETHIDRENMLMKTLRNKMEKIFDRLNWGKPNFEENELENYFAGW